MRLAPHHAADPEFRPLLHRERLGAPRVIDSISTTETFSPATLRMSPPRPTNVTSPSESMRPRSPVLNQTKPSSLLSAIAARECLLIVAVSRKQRQAWVSTDLYFPDLVDIDRIARLRISQPHVAARCRRADRRLRRIQAGGSSTPPATFRSFHRSVAAASHQPGEPLILIVGEVLREPHMFERLRERHWLGASQNHADRRREQRRVVARNRSACCRKRDAENPAISITVPPTEMEADSE